MVRVTTCTCTVGVDAYGGGEPGGGFGWPARAHEDYSCLGSEEAENGQYVVILLVWVRLILEDLPPIALHENTKNFKAALVAAMLPDYVHIELVDLLPEHHGNTAIARTRRVDRQHG